jgi:hypothetical protein
MDAAVAGARCHVQGWAVGAQTSGGCSWGTEASCVHGIQCNIQCMRRLLAINPHMVALCGRWQHPVLLSTLLDIPQNT